MPALTLNDVRRNVQEARDRGLATNLSSRGLSGNELPYADLDGVIDAVIKAYSKWENKNRETK